MAFLEAVFSAQTLRGEPPNSHLRSGRIPGLHPRARYALPLVSTLNNGVLHQRWQLNRRHPARNQPTHRPHPSACESFHLFHCESDALLYCNLLHPLVGRFRLCSD